MHAVGGNGRDALGRHSTYIESAYRSSAESKGTGS
ncbi:hypothetical protein LMG31886_18460 [Xanthomonas hydrangeae]|nr:hypothetical protein LMG31884_19400 [Xanthomonas hydrangeae]CAD7716031.1 hypothetical protein LMG31884_19400 [Xanthomonas hydrangeae]CAD7730135.1 hypothetical protein LMG31887_19390 [Xanthomonas hydrangeae]CAD7730139.1 hypothetical protein LMG31887_19390 [Xanthomonas hydrangeae]CAD7733125.1 hypothetical protein LMG31886_18460 [Xanthomonas hydrangeae]